MSRIKDLVHYVISIDTEQKLGSVKLNKVLWFSDRYHYMKHRKSISGEEYYIKQERGPVVERMPVIINDLQNEKKISAQDVQHYIYTKTEYKSLVDCDLHLSGEETKIIHQVLREICDNYTATEISEATHDIVWRAAKIGEQIPLYTVFASRPAVITEDDIKWAKTCVPVAS